MIKATVTLTNGETVNIDVNSDDYNELFKLLKGLDMVAMDAKVVSLKDFRQGRCG